MAGITILVSFDGWLVSGHELVGGMAAGAVAIKLMVLDVTPGALDHGGIGPEGNRLDVTLHALQALMFPMLEGNRSRPRGVGQDGNSYHHRPCGGQFG
jgi:hypothetical protein